MTTMAAIPTPAPPVERACAFCLHMGARVKFDCKGRPFLTCRVCCVRGFLHDEASQAGLALVDALTRFVPLEELRAFAWSAGAQIGPSLAPALAAFAAARAPAPAPAAANAAHENAGAA